MKPTLSIIIVNWNTKKLLKQCIESILRNDKRLDFSGRMLNKDEEEKITTELIIVDNGSTDESIQTIQNLKIKNQNDNLKFKIVQNKENLGFGRANNQGMKIAKGDYVLLLNSDTKVEEGAVSETLFWLSAHPEYDLVGCRLVNADKSVQPSVGVFPSLASVFSMLFLDKALRRKTTMVSPEKASAVDWVMGAFMMLRKEVFEKSGGFDENIFMYFEEVEWCWRLKNLGFRVGFYPEAKVIHLGGGSLTNSPKERIFGIYKGLVYFYGKHKPKWQLKLIKLMLKTKAGISFLGGTIFNNHYLKETYGKAFDLV